jgi:carbamoyl-phosphate synthase large subunit
MPKRTDINSILIIGAGPIVIGQACEFDYSGTQACQALKEEGYRIILVNSNPATIMTDPDYADVTYIEPVNWQTLERIIAIEKPDAILPTMGGQTALNTALDLAKHGVLEKYQVELIGASRAAIDKAEDREKFRQAMHKIGLATPLSAIAHSLEEALQVQAQFGYPTIIRPSFTLGGTGGGIAYNREEFIEICERGLELSPTHELLIEESVIGWKEFEMEVVRDSKDNCIIVCSIENVDAMGVHTGDSITVAPAQTLTDKEYQIMRDAAIKVLREIGVDTGGSNVQFAVNPADGRLVVIEMNPRVSRSSALASKATGFPIAKVAAKLAVGYTLDELKNEITQGKTPTSFEPTIDYVVTKIPRFNFEKFPGSDAKLTTQMKSVGEVMAMGRTFQESLQKALRGLEVGHYGLEPLLDLTAPDIKEILMSDIATPGPDRLLYIADAFRYGLSVEDIHLRSGIDPWFLVQIEDLIRTETQIKSCTLSGLTAHQLLQFKRKGFADKRLADLLSTSEDAVRAKRITFNVHPVYKRVDTCSAEFSTNTAYLYSTYEQYCESNPTNREKIMVLGGGPNRIGQGIEFDYCCVHAAMAVREAGYEAIMVNCNPETVSTDYNVSDRLYFEPVTLEDVLEIARIEKPKGVIVQYGGQTPLKLARALEKAGVPIIGTSPDAIDAAEDRERFRQLVTALDLHQPPNQTVTTLAQGLRAAELITYPLMVRPSYVLGGRAMEVVYNENELREYLTQAVLVSNDSPVLLDKFLDNAIEVDVDAICDGKQVFIGGIMEHIEQAGVHSGDSSCALPPHHLSAATQADIITQITKLALALNVVGLINAQFAIQNEKIYILEVNPRASRTTPFVSKTIGVPLAKVAARCMLGFSLKSQGLNKIKALPYFAVKAPVFPFDRFLGTDPILGPEMKSTGEVMGVGNTFVEAYAKAQLAANMPPIKIGRVFISVRDEDKAPAVLLATQLHKQGFEIVATKGTARALTEAGIICTSVNKVREGRPHIVDMIKSNQIDFIINTTQGKQAIRDSFTIRRSALQNKIHYMTTIAGAQASLSTLNMQASEVYAVQDLHKAVVAANVSEQLVDA